jgi:hypothetical protein
MMRMLPPSLFVQSGSWRATRHLLIRAHGASGKVAGGGHVTSSGSRPTVYRRPARTRVAFRKKLYATIDDLQADLDAWMREFNEARPHQGKWCFGKTPMQTFLDALPLAREKSNQVQADVQHDAA